jgi:phage portal protein BeeE
MNWLNRLTRGRTNAPDETKSHAGHTVVSLSELREATWSGRGFASLVNQGFKRNPVVYRCVRLIAEAANRVPLTVSEGGKRVSEHPLLALLGRPNPHQSGGEMLEALYAYLQTAGNAYLQAVMAEGEVRGLYCLRPDRMKVIAGRDGWPAAYAYTAGGRTVQLGQDTMPVPNVLHLALFHPMDDHYGMGAARGGADESRHSQCRGGLEQGAARQCGAAFRGACLFDGRWKPDARAVRAA